MPTWLQTIDVKKLVARAGAGVSAAAGLAVKQPALLHSLAGWLTLAIIAGMVAYPWEPGNAGVLRPLTPGQLSLAEKLAGGAAAILSAPAARRVQAKRELLAEVERAAQAATLATLAKTGQFSAARLGQKEAGQKDPAGLDLDPDRFSADVAARANT